MNNKLFRHAYRKNFNKNGFVLIKNYFSDNEAQFIKDSANKIESWRDTHGKWMTYYENKDNNKIKSRVENFINYDNSIKTFLNLQITPIVNFINEDNMNLFKEKINWKMPNGSGFRAHQDYPAWSDFKPRKYVTATVFADDNTVENGCVQFPTNYYDYLNINKYPNDYLLESEENDLGVLKPKIVNELEWFNAESSSRDLLIFNSFIPHKSEKNISENPRRNFYFTYNHSYDGDLYNSYFERKREEFPPDIERQANKNYSVRNTRYNLANPID